VSLTTASTVRGFIADLDCVASDPAAAVHRLSVALASTAGVPDVSRVILRHISGALCASGAALAVPGPAVPFSIVATYGAPQVATAALWTALNAGGDTDGTPETHLRVGRFLIQEISAAGQVLAFVSIAERLDSRAFTRADAAVLRALSAPAALALEREAIRRKAAAFARAAAIDPVSGLYNRRHFHARLQEELQRAERRDSSVALLMIDLDDFKRINDTYGHAAGDATIRAAATIIRRSVRPFDICTRYGGEEFAVVMPDGSSSVAETVAERIRSRIGAWRPAEPAMTSLRITASIGFALGHGTTTSDDFLARADRALYAAKHAGKNQVRAAAS
jgi:diguanylate cyclase (GGDEF)-like protein